MSACKSRGAEIVWAVTEQGRRIPVDMEPRPDGNLVLFKRPTDPIAKKYDPEKHALLTRRVSHFATCPNAASHRRKEGSR